MDELIKAIRKSYKNSKCQGAKTHVETVYTLLPITPSLSLYTSLLSIDGTVSPKNDLFERIDLFTISEFMITLNNPPLNHHLLLRFLVCR